MFDATFRVSIRLSQGMSCGFEWRLDPPRKTKMLVCICIHLRICASAHKCWLWIYISSAVLGHEANTGSGTAFSFLLIGSTSLAKQDQVPSTRAFTTSLGFFFWFLCLLLLASLAFCSASQRGTIEGIRITIEFFSPCNFDKAWRFNESLWKEKWSLVSNPSSVRVSIRQFIPDL